MWQTMTYFYVTQIYYIIIHRQLCRQNNKNPSCAILPSIWQRNFKNINVGKICSPTAYRLAGYSAILTTNGILHKYVLFKYQLIFFSFPVNCLLKCMNKPIICSLVTSVYLGTMKQGCFKPLHDCFGFSSLNNTFKKSHDCLRKLLTLIKSQLLITFFLRDA